MKNKILVFNTIIIFILLTLFNFYQTKAYNEELQTTDYTAQTLETQQEGANEEVTDFSNAKFELKKQGDANAYLEISGITPKEDSEYYLFITNDNNKPDVTSTSSGKIWMKYDETSKNLKSVAVEDIEKNIELNQELYATIVEKTKKSDNVVTYGIKLNRFEEEKYYGAFRTTFIAKNSTQIVTKFTHAANNNRKMQIKVGKITDNSILQKIKSNNITGFSELLSYAESSSGIYDQTLSADIDSTNISYNDYKTGNSAIELNGIENDAYYFLYVKTDDENGKYISNSAVTLGKSYVNDSGWGISFYGSSDFEWNDFDSDKTDDNNTNGNTTNDNKINDNTVSNMVLPKTGLEIFIFSAIVLVVVTVGAFSYIQYKKNNF